MNSSSKSLKEKLDIVLGGANIIHTNHEELYDLLYSNYIKYKKKMEFTYKGIDLKKFNINDKSIIEKSKILKKDLGLEWKFIVLFLWNLVDFKDPTTFVKVTKLLSDNKNIYFLMVGEWELSKEIDKYINKNELKNIKCLWSRSDINVLYGMSDVFCALSPYENIWSTTIQEAFCMWVPSVITNVGYTEKILKNETGILLIKPRDKKELRGAILKFYNNNKLLKKVSVSLSNKWTSEFDNKKLAKGNYDKLYKWFI